MERLNLNETNLISLEYEIQADPVIFSREPAEIQFRYGSMMDGFHLILRWIPGHTERTPAGPCIPIFFIHALSLHYYFRDIHGNVQAQRLLVRTFGYSNRVPGHQCDRPMCPVPTHLRQCGGKRFPAVLVSIVIFPTRLLLF